MPIDSNIELIGNLTNSEGTIKYKNVTAFKDVIFTDMVIGHYDSIAGDSGGAILNANNGYKIVGVHQGFICTFSTYSENLGEVLQNFTNTHICPSDGSSYFKLFTPWQNVKNALQLQ